LFGWEEDFWAPDFPKGLNRSALAALVHGVLVVGVLLHVQTLYFESQAQISCGWELGRLFGKQQARNVYIWLGIANNSMLNMIH